MGTFKKVKKSAKKASKKAKKGVSKANVVVDKTSKYTAKVGKPLERYGGAVPVFGGAIEKIGLVAQDQRAYTKKLTDFVDAATDEKTSLPRVPSSVGIRTATNQLLYSKIPSSLKNPRIAIQSSKGLLGLGDLFGFL